MARALSFRRKSLNTVLAWTVALVIFFPILWTLMTSFKTEGQAINDPPLFLPSFSSEAPKATQPANEGFNAASATDACAEYKVHAPQPTEGEQPRSVFFDFTLENYCEVWNSPRSDYPSALFNSIIIAVGSTLLGIIIAIPAAWSMAFVPSRRTKDILLWMLSTKMLPAVGVLYPMSLLFVWTGLLDTLFGLVMVLMLINLPIIIWMLYTYFREIPGEILEAARVDGASLKSEILYVLTPMALPGIASTVLLNIILAWNEAFWTLQLTAAKAAPLTAFIASYSSPEGLFYAKLSAASMMAIAPILVMGWFSQKQLVRGLTFGAVK